MKAERKIECAAEDPTKDKRSQGFVHRKRRRRGPLWVGQACRAKVPAAVTAELTESTGRGAGGGGRARSRRQESLRCRRAQCQRLPARCCL